MRKRNGPSPETRGIYGPLTARVPMPRVQFYRKGERPIRTTSAYPIAQPTVEEPHPDAPPEVEPFEGTKPFNLTLIVAPENERDKFSALEHKHTYREIRPNRAPGQRGAYQVEMTYPEYQRALEDTRDPGVNLISVEPEIEFYHPSVPAGSILEYVAAENAAVTGHDGKGVIIGSVDSGVSPAVKSSVLAGRIKDEEVFGTGATDGYFNDHGTAMVGMAIPPASQVAIAACSISNANIAAGIHWCVDTVGVHMMYIEFASATDTSIIRDAVAHALSKNVLVLSAAGNGGADNIGSGENIDLYPASQSGVLCISNYRPSTDSIASTSNYGSHVFAAAPGCEVNYYQLDGSEDYRDDLGTSGALAQAAYVFGSLMSGGISASAAKDKLAKTARKTGASSIYEGNGVLQLEPAVAVGTQNPGSGPGSTSETDSGAGGSGDFGSIDFPPAPGGDPGPIEPGDPGSPEAECGVDPNNDTPEANETRAYVLQTQDPDETVANAAINWLLAEYFEIYHQTPEEANPELWAHILATCNTGYFCADIHTVPIRFIVECEHSYSYVYAPPETPFPLPGARDFYMEHVQRVENLDASGTDTVYYPENIYRGGPLLNIPTQSRDIFIGCVKGPEYQWKSLGRTDVHLTDVSVVHFTEEQALQYSQTSLPTLTQSGSWTRPTVSAGWHIRFLGRSTHQFDLERSRTYSYVTKQYGDSHYSVVSRIGLMAMISKIRFQRRESDPAIDPTDPLQVNHSWNGNERIMIPHSYFGTTQRAVPTNEGEEALYDELIAEQGAQPFFEVASTGTIYYSIAAYPDQTGQTVLYWDTPERGVYAPIPYGPGLKPNPGRWNYDNAPHWLGYSIGARDLDTRYMRYPLCGGWVSDFAWYSEHDGPGGSGRSWRYAIDVYGRWSENELVPFNWTNQLVTTTTVKITGVYVGPWPPPDDGGGDNAGDMPELNTGLDLDNPPTMDIPFPDLDLPCVSIADVGVGMCLEDMTMPEIPMPCFPDFPFGDCAPTPGTGSGIGDFGPGGDIPDDGMGNGIGTGITAGKDTFAEDKCFAAGTSLEEAINELSDLLGLDEDQMTIEGTCDDILENEKCFPKGSSIWDAIWWFSDQCGKLPIDGGDTVTIANPTPLDTTWILNEYTNLFDFTPVIDNSELFWGVEVFRADITNGGTVITPGLEVLVQVPTPFAADPQEIFRVSVDKSVTELEATRMAKGLAARMGRVSFRVTATTFFNPNVRLRHRIRIVRPSKDFDMEFMCTSITHDLSESGKFTTVEAQVILPAPTLVPA